MELRDNDILQNGDLVFFDGSSYFSTLTNPRYIGERVSVLRGVMSNISKVSRVTAMDDICDRLCSGLEQIRIGLWLED